MMRPYTCPCCHEAIDAHESVCAHCDTERPRGGWPLDRHLGRVIAGRYRLVARLGKGGVGEVFQARDDSSAGELGDVVVKLLGATTVNEINTRRFLNEARAARSLTGPHVVKIYDFGF